MNKFEVKDSTGTIIKINADGHRGSCYKSLSFWVFKENRFEQTIAEFLHPVWMMKLKDEGAKDE